MDEAERKFEVHKIDLEHRFQAAKLADEQTFEREKIDRTHKHEAGKEYARQILEYTLQHDRHLKDYGQMALRSVFLLNGGAIIALLTFIGSASGKTIGASVIAPALFVVAFSFFSAGLVCAVISITSAYLNYMGHKHVNADPGWLANNIIAQQEKWPGNHSVSNSRFINWTWHVALFTGIVSLTMFGIGCYKVAAVFEVLK
jgi:hypothetical protein